ncbi:MAG: hypothetical protein ACRDV4_10245, partial [Acidimicrobiales bacterium]
RGSGRRRLARRGSRGARRHEMRREDPHGAGTNPGYAHVRAGARTVVSAVMWRPWLWPVAVAETLRLAKPGWWRRWPPLPVPDEALWSFRVETAYDVRSGWPASADEVRSFLEWCRRARGWRSN